MKFLFVNPPVQSNFIFSFIPHGLLEVMSIFKSDGHGLALIDLMNSQRNRFTKEDLAFIRESHFDAILMGGFVTHLYTIRKLVGQIREAQNNSFVITGGVGYVGIYAEGLRYTDCDVVVCGEVFPMAQALYHFIQSKQKTDLPEGVIYRDRDGSIHGTKIQNEVTDLNRLPFPYYDLFEIERMSRRSFAGFNTEISFDMYTSRGCPFRCNYCVNSHPDFQKRSKYRIKETSRVVAEVKYLKEKFHAVHIYFTDEEFAINKARALDLCAALAELNIAWSTSNRVDTFDEEMVRAMKECGCRYIYLGIETISPHIHDMMNKGVRLEKIQRGVDLLRKYDVGIFPNFMIGYFGETQKTLLDTIVFAKKNNLVYIAPFYTLYPSTKDYLTHTAHRLSLDEFLRRVGSSDISPLPVTNVTEMSDWRLVYLRNYAFAVTKAASVSGNAVLGKALMLFYLCALYLYYFCIPSLGKAVVRRYMWPFLITMKKY